MHDDVVEDVPAPAAVRELVLVTGVDAAAFVSMCAKMKPWAREPYAGKARAVILRVGALPRLELIGVRETPYDADAERGEVGFAVHSVLRATVVNHLDFAAIDAVNVCKLLKNATGTLTFSRTTATSYGNRFTIIRITVTPASETTGKKKKRVTASHYDLAEIECPKNWLVGGDESTPGRERVPQFIDMRGPFSNVGSVTMQTTEFDAAVLRDALEITLPAMGREDTRPMCQQLFIGADGSRTMMLATDGHRAVRTYLDMACPFGTSVVIPGQLTKILATAKGPVRVSWARWDGDSDTMKGTAWIRVQLGNMTWTLARREKSCASLPPILQIIGDTNDTLQYGRVRVDGVALQQLLAQAAVVCGAVEGVDICVSDSEDFAGVDATLEISACHPELGLMRGDTPVIDSSSKLRVRLNISYVRAAVESTVDAAGIVDIRYSHGHEQNNIAPVYFIGDGREVLIMPMRP